MINWGARIAWSLTRRRYTAPVVADTPDNRWLLALACGTPRKLITAGLTWLIVSADAATPATYETYRRGGNFELVVANVRRFAARRRALGTRTPFLEWQFVPLRHTK
jgi:hypothetical protein